MELPTLPAALLCVVLALGLSVDAQVEPACGVQGCNPDAALRPSEPEEGSETSLVQKFRNYNLAGPSGTYTRVLKFIRVVKGTAEQIHANVSACAEAYPFLHHSIVVSEVESSSKAKAIVVGREVTLHPAGLSDRWEYMSSNINGYLEELNVSRVTLVVSHITHKDLVEVLVPAPAGMRPAAASCIFQSCITDALTGTCEGW